MDGPSKQTSRVDRLLLHEKRVQRPGQGQILWGVSEQGAGVSKGLFETIGMDVWLCCAMACDAMGCNATNDNECVAVHRCSCLPCACYLPLLEHITTFRNSAQCQMCICEIALCLNFTMVNISLPQKAIREPHDSEEVWPSKLAARTLCEGVYVYFGSQYCNGRL